MAQTVTCEEIARPVRARTDAPAGRDAPVSRTPARIKFSVKSERQLGIAPTPPGAVDIQQSPAHADMHTCMLA